ncbi:MAG: hypothetical protein A2857_00285 [Candidatus Levybacteria bacterium RIFCSPHIGHO2_01_FULL_36_15]|uniref:PsbP C-terminal domain-containing protein n=1 Tax=candidate division WWE3 bacterium RIFCSPLOWO2_01_FULL_37_15 TaxID=1802622 RepID=A0A1F4V198_UNCKA|nr:MAG: hypothetical protein A3A69_00260 [candidate division WWE3 bacterium RIFCSPLOWO2_01_FULL_37_15]OGH11841.1 MAG: hypothetical protein A2857_00285 [Candidatus Levybacteria bacterium RIFCSPHIGHO2_01_FULL_36_15]
MNKFLIAVLIIIIISYGAWYLNKSNHIDINYRFIITNFNGWEEIPRKLGAYKSFATKNDTILVSYADIRLLKKEKSLSEATMKEISKEECQNLVNEPYITSNEMETSEFKKDESTVIMCRGEGMGTTNKVPTIITIYYFFGLNNDILIFTTSYPRDNKTEKIYEKNLIDGFRFF